MTEFSFVGDISLPPLQHEHTHLMHCVIQIFTQSGDFLICCVSSLLCKLIPVKDIHIMTENEQNITTLLHAQTHGLNTKTVNSALWFRL